eukprot:768087-Hanusia_phi.AAC.6
MRESEQEKDKRKVERRFRRGEERRGEERRGESQSTSKPVASSSISSAAFYIPAVLPEGQPSRSPAPLLLPIAASREETGFLRYPYHLLTLTTHQLSQAPG